MENIAKISVEHRKEKAANEKHRLKAIQAAAWNRQKPLSQEKVGVFSIFY